MKIRNGFVSNSSSSSFLVLVKDSREPACTCALGKLSFWDLLRICEEDPEGSYSSDFEDILEYLDECETSEDKQSSKEKLLDLLKTPPKGYEPLELSLEYRGSLRELIYHIDNLAVILYSDEEGLNTENLERMHALIESD